MSDTDPKFTLYWRTGEREVVQGRTIAEAMTLAGYSQGALGALDFYGNGDNHDYAWKEGTREWHRVMCLVCGLPGAECRCPTIGQGPTP